MRRFRNILLTALTLTAASCSLKETGSKEYVAPSIVSSEAVVSGDSVSFTCVLSSSRAEKVGFAYGITGEQESVLLALPSGDSFKAVAKGLEYGKTYQWHAFATAGNNVIKSENESFTVPERPFNPKAIPIEDPCFKAYLVENYDSDGDGEISLYEAEQINLIRIVTNRYNVQSLQGIEYMPNLIHIDCPGDWYDSYNTSNEAYSSPYKYTESPLFRKEGNHWHGPIGTLRSIDVSKNKRLQDLWLYNNAALGVHQKTIDLSQNPDLKILNLDGTMMDYPDVSKNNNLQQLSLGQCRNPSMPDLSKMPWLIRLNLEYPVDDQGHHIGPCLNVDVSSNHYLEWIAVSSAALTLSDLSNNPKLKELHYPYCSSIGLVDISSLKQLEVLSIIKNGISGKLILTDNPKLVSIYAEENIISEVDLTSCTNLKTVHLWDNLVSSLSLPESVETLKCWGNPLGSVDVSSLPSLSVLECANSGLTSLDVSHNPALRVLSINGNQLGTIDLSANKELEELACWNCGLTTLDLTNNTKLTWIRCWENQIRTLDLSHNPQVGKKNTGNPNSNGLWCSPMNDSSGKNLLDVLYVAPGQVIPNVTENRSDKCIPSGTRIVVKQD